MRPLGVSLIGGFELFISGLLLLLAIARFWGWACWARFWGALRAWVVPQCPFSLARE